MLPTGESGSVKSSEANLEQVSPPPTQIAADTSIETLSHVIERDWIWKQTVAVSTTMPPGTVFAILPVHPFECNKFVKHVAEMFNCWTGGMHIRLRMMATAFYGGSLRVGFLPPNLTPNQIRNMTLDTLTVYPNNDFDPKNTNWVHFSTADERDVMFHYMSPTAKGWDENDKRSFAGYIVLYVVGKLVTQSPDISSIQVVIETAGNFMFSQINPQFGQIDYSDNAGSLGEAARYAEHWIPCDVQTMGGLPYVGILPNTVTNVSFGGFNMEPFYGTLDDTPGVHIDPMKKEQLTACAVSPLTRGIANRLTTAVPWTYKDVPGLPNMAHVMLDDNGSFTVCPDAHVDSKTEGAIWDSEFGLVKYTCDSPDTTGYTGATEAYNGVSNVDVDTWQSCFTLPPTVTDSTFAPNSVNENIVTLFGHGRISPALQPIQFKQYLKTNKSTDSQNSEVYLLKRADGTTALVLRLNPNGMLTCAIGASALSFQIEKGMHLQFLQDLPINEPLPLTRAMRRQQKMFIFECEVKRNPGKYGLHKDLVNFVF
jgi:hypothetical protein